MKRRDTIINNAEALAFKIEGHKVIAENCNSGLEIIDLHERMIILVRETSEVLKEVDVSDNYLNQFEQQISDVSTAFPFLNQIDNPDFVGENNRDSLRLTILGSRANLNAVLKQIQFNHEFFNKLGFFQHNIVAIGANGSGKTTLANELKRYLPQHGVVISAQKILLIPTFSGISNINSTSQKLSSAQVADKTYKSTYSTEGGGNAYGLLVQLGGEFHVLLDNLLAERSAARNQYCEAAVSSKEYRDVPETKLDRALNIWNSLLPHRTISCSDGINITLNMASGETYPAYQMSDGEKVLLFLVAQVLQAPASGFIVVDEPEMYLHKTIVDKLWDTLEAERSDCIFVYLTHDLHFATSRVGSKKIWIKSFKHPNLWEIEGVPDNELPEQLLLELLGSRKNILFCEGTHNSLDVKLFSILFPHLTICPVDSCFDVINYTKAFNKLPMVATKALGLIDSDYHDSQRLTSLTSESIYSYSMAEIENLLLDEGFLNVIARQLLKDKSVTDSIKQDILDKLREDIELQVSNYVSAKINYYFRSSHVTRGRNANEIQEHFASFIGAVDIPAWHDERKQELQKIISEKNYSRALQVYNNKGLKAIVQRHLKISDFSDMAVRVLIEKSETRCILKRHFPVLLSEA
ncbi:AAA family ATPase [Pseudomonas helleri]|uniref:AAA family ATPase n=3 Tax=Pseudomonas helleri TaxID=1608996 RepID=UPI003FD4AD01